MTRTLRLGFALMLFVAALVTVIALWLGNRGSTRLQAMAAADVHGDFSLAAIARDVRRYDDLGIHRTGSAGDLATTDWLESTLRELGYEVRRQPFTIETSIPQQTYLDTGDRRLEAFPLFPVTSTGPAGIRAQLKLWEPTDEAGMAGVIAVVDTDQSEHQGTLASRPFYERLSAAASSGASAVVVLTRAGCGTYQALNADLRLPDWPVPVVLVGERDAEFLFSAIAAGEPVALLSRARRKTVTAYNLIAETGPAGTEPVVVSTPQSGWFHAAGERGSGMAVFLALARWAARQTDSRFVLLANSGHERGNAGAHHAIQGFPDARNIAFWLHIGANIGTLQVSPEKGVVPTRYAMASWFIVPQAWSVLHTQPGSLAWPVPLELGLAKGELAEYHERGYRPLLGIFGPSPYHHCANDRFEMVSPDATRDVALAMAVLLDSAAVR